MPFESLRRVTTGTGGSVELTRGREVWTGSAPDSQRAFHKGQTTLPYGSILCSLQENLSRLVLHYRTGGTLCYLLACRIEEVHSICPSSIHHPLLPTFRAALEPCWSPCHRGDLGDLQ